MFIDSITITNEKPPAFKDINEICYVIIKIHSLEFFSWSKTTIESSFQIPIIEKDNIGGILYYLAKNILHLAYDNPICINDTLLEKFKYDKKYFTKINKEDSFSRFYWENIEGE